MKKKSEIIKIIKRNYDEVKNHFDSMAEKYMPILSHEKPVTEEDIKEAHQMLCVAGARFNLIEEIKNEVMK